MSAVLTTEPVFESFLSGERSRGFLHSHSYTGNPLGCAAALASLAIFSSDNVLENNRVTAAHMRRLSRSWNSIRTSPRSAKPA